MHLGTLALGDVAQPLVSLGLKIDCCQMPALSDDGLFSAASQRSAAAS